MKRPREGLIIRKEGAECPVYERKGEPFKGGKDRGFFKEKILPSHTEKKKNSSSCSKTSSSAGRGRRTCRKEEILS